MRGTLALVGCTAAALALGSIAAQAGIKCREGYQVVNGNEIATPYCTDAYIAQVAREHGVKATAERVRNNPSFRDEVCRFVGSDIRIREDCNLDDGDDRGR
jgi:hypothetical protein